MAHVLVILSEHSIRQSSGLSNSRARGASAGRLREAGCTVHDGAGMLVAQAVATVHAVCDLAEVDVALSDDELFALMAEAAGFDL